MNEQSSEERGDRIVFVAGGEPKHIRPVGRKWIFGDDYIEFFDGPRSLVYAGRTVETGDFQLTARLAVTQGGERADFRRRNRRKGTRIRQEADQLPAGAGQ